MATKEMVFIVGIATLFICVAFGGADNYCYMEDKNPYLYFGTKTPYELVAASEMKLPKSECSPVYMWALIRHGTRYGERKDFPSLEKLKDQIISNHETDKRGALCAKDLTNLKQWTFSWKEETDNDLASQGKAQMAALAQRLNTKFADLLSKSRPAFVLQSSSKRRAMNSLDAFKTAFLKREHSVTISINDDLLRPKPEEGDTSIEENEFKKSSPMLKLVVDVSDRLGFSQPLSLDVIKEMYVVCALENALAPKSTPAFCAAFTESQLILLEYLFADLREYYKFGYGTSSNIDVGNSLIKDMMTKLTQAATNENSSPTGTYYFGHTETIFPAIVKLNLYRDEEHLKHDNFEKLKDTRKWRTSKLSPFAANLIAVLFKCRPENDFKVVFYHNEHVVEYPDCPEGLCSLEFLQKKFGIQTTETKDDKTDEKNKSGSGGTSTKATESTIFIAATLSIIVFTATIPW